MKNQRGQALIEALIAGSTTFFSVALILMMFYRGLVYFTARHCLNDLLFCLVSLSSQDECEQEFRNKTAYFLIFKETSKLDVSKTKSEIRVGFLVNSPGTPEMKLSRKIDLPLKRNL